MITLARLQADFQRYLLNDDKKIHTHVAGTAEASREQRLQVYGHAYGARLMEALRQDFPGLKTIMGDDEFELAGRAYIDRFPSSHPSLRWFGRHFAEFLKSHEIHGARALWHEIAAFEWGTGECFDAADTPVLDVEAVGRISAERWAGMRFSMQPGLRRLSLHFNAPLLWKAVHDKDTPPEPEYSPQPVPWLLWRKEMKIHWRSLSADEVAALDAAAQGQSFGELCELLCAHVGETAAPMRAASLLRQWLSDGLIGRLHFDER